jgi:hypothetical protein
VLKLNNKPYLIINKKPNLTKQNLRNYGNIRKKKMNFAYGMAAVVIVGALLKLLTLN